MKRLAKWLTVLAAAVMLSGCCSIIPDEIVEYVPWCDGPEAPALEGHSAYFLYSDAAERMMNILSPILPYDVFKAYVQRMKGDGADYCYLFLINEHDGGWTPYSFYVGNQIGGTINQAVVDEYIRRIEYIRDEGMGIVFVLRPDDSPNFVRNLGMSPSITAHEDLVELGVSPLYAPAEGLNFKVASTASQLQYQVDACRLFVNPYGNQGLWVGLELDEYYNATQVEAYAAHLQGLTEAQIGTHQKPDRYDFARLPSVDMCWYQYGWNKSPAHIQAKTAEVAGILGKPVVASEYARSSDSEAARNQGDGAMRGGAYGTGNGRH